MADLKYVVDVDLNVDPGSAGKIGRVGPVLGDLARDAKKVGKSLSDGLDGAIDKFEKIGGKLFAAAKIGGAAGVGAVTYGVLGLNQELETTQVSLAAVLNANKIGGGIEGAMGVAAGWVRQMRQDAKELPGEFSDLLQIVQSGASAAFNAGLDVTKFEKLASQAMAAGKAMAVPIDQAGRELAQLLEGRAGAHNVFGTRLGIHADDFKGKTPEQRVQMITDALGKFEPAIKVFGATMDAQSSTLVDNAKLFLGTATLPLFGRIKDTLAEVNSWFDANRATVDRYAERVGDFLVTAFDRGKAVVLEYGPLLLDFAGRAYDELTKIWIDVEPYVKSVGSEIKDFLKSDSSLDKIKTVLELYIAAKGVGGVASAVGFLAPLAKAAAPQVGPAIGAAGSFINQLAGGAGAPTVVGSGAAEGGLAAVGVSAGAAAAALGLLVGSVALADHYAAEQQDRETITGNQLVESYVNASARAAMMADGFGFASGVIDKSSTEYQDSFEHLKSISQRLADTYSEGVDKVNAAIMDIAETSGIVVNMNSKLADVITKINAAPVTKLVAEPSPLDPRAEAQAAAERKAKAGRGAGGTVIHKVEISVSTNQNPGQVARQVGAFLAHSSRFRTSSPYTRSFTSPG